MKHTIKTFFTLALVLALFGMTACKGPSDNNSDGTDEGVRPWTAELTLSSDKLGIKVTVTTDDGTPVTVEGCTETELKSGTETDLNANGTTVKLTGKITALSCSNNKLTGLNVRSGLTALRSLSCDKNELASLDVQGCTVLYNLSCDSNKLPSLNVQGCTALKGVDCLSNKLDAQAFTKLFGDLPARTGYAYCYLYTDEKGVSEGNCKDFTNSPDLKAAFEKAKDEKKWTMYKIDTDKSMVEI